VTATGARTASRSSTRLTSAERRNSVLQVCSPAVCSSSNNTLDVNPGGKIIASVPASALTGVDLSTAGYQVSMFSDAEDGEGIGNVRPIHSADCARGVN